MTFCTCDFVTDWSIASYQEISSRAQVEDKLATPSLYICRQNATLAGVIPHPFDIAAKWQNSLTSEMSRYRCYSNSLSISFDVATLCI